MALRIGGAPKAPAQAQQQPDPSQLAQLLGQASGGAGTPSPTDPDGDGDDDSTPGGDTDQDAGGGQVDPDIAGYQGPDQGPFMCANCIHFQSPNACEIVSGQVDHLGCCNLFTSAGSQQMPTDDTGGDEGDAGNMQQTGTSQPTTEPDEPEGT